MDILNYIKNLCTPAYVYLVISFIAIFSLMYEKSPEYSNYCLNKFGCKVGTMTIIILTQGLLTVIWAVILDKICKRGYPGISWFLLALPYLMFFVAIWLLIHYGKFKKKKKKKRRLE